MARKSISKTPVGERLSHVREELKFPSRAALAAKLGMNAETLGGYERGDSNPDLELLSRYSQEFSVNLHWVLTGSGSMFQSKPPAEPSSPDSKTSGVPRLPASLTAQDDGIVLLPRYDVKASAGRGLIPISDMPTGEVAFSRDFLRKMGGNPDHCYALEASGDSMWPTIDDGDLMIADGSQTEIDDGRIYHFNAGERVLVKRARWAMDGRLRLTSDNAAAGYPDEIIDAGTAEDYRAGGRIIFSGGSPPPVR